MEKKINTLSPQKPIAYSLLNLPPKSYKPSSNNLSGKKGKGKGGVSTPPSPLNKPTFFQSKEEGLLLDRILLKLGIPPLPQANSKRLRIKKKGKPVPGFPFFYSAVAFRYVIKGRTFFPLYTKNKKEQFFNKGILSNGFLLMSKKISKKTFLKRIRNLENDYKKKLLELKIKALYERIKQQVLQEIKKYKKRSRKNIKKKKEWFKKQQADLAARRKEQAKRKEVKANVMLSATSQPTTPPETLSSNKINNNANKHYIKENNALKKKEDYKRKKRPISFDNPMFKWTPIT